MAEYITPYYPAEAYAAAKAWQAQGKMVMAIAYPKSPPELHHCGNCQGEGVVNLSFIGGGPFPHADAAKKAHTWLEADGERGRGAGWYVIEKNMPYPCPHCQGLKSKAHTPKPKPEAVKQVQEVAKQLRIPARADLE